MPNTYGAGADGNLPADMGEVEIPDVQVTIRSSQNMLQFRELTVSVHKMLLLRASKPDSSHLDFFYTAGRYLDQARSITRHRHQCLSTLFSGFNAQSPV